MISFKKIIFSLGLSSLSLFLLFYISQAFEIKSSTEPQTQKLTIMTYNVENLFDTEDDPFKEDETYLPLKVKRSSPQIQQICRKLKSKEWQKECLTLNWDETTLSRKMKRLADIILKSHQGVGPDILLLQEVENLKVLEKLRTLYLKKYYPYQALLLEGPDRRGIDTAILSKLPNISAPQLHLLTFKEEKNLPFSRLPKSRGILEASFLLPDQSPLHVFSVHFPSQGTPSPARQQALNQVIHLISQKPKDDLVIVGGDFNITKNEDEKNKYLESLQKKFLISHFVGCKFCKGTNYFHPRRSWSFLDVLIFSNHFKDPKFNWILNVDSVRVFNTNLYQNNKWGSPMKFEGGKHQKGISDHWPLLADIVLNSSRSKGTRK